jgi:hypothetical protein
VGGLDTPSSRLSPTARCSRFPALSSPAQFSVPIIIKFYLKGIVSRALHICFLYESIDLKFLHI